MSDFVYKVKRAEIRFQAELSTGEKITLSLLETNARQLQELTKESGISENLEATIKQLKENLAFSNIMSEAQNSITQGFSTALSDAFTNSRVMKGMQDAFGSVFEKLMGEDGALGKLFGEGGALGGLMESAGAAIAGFSIGNSVGGIATSLLGDEGNKKIADITTKVGSGIGAAAGAAIAGPLGAVVGGAIGGLVGALGGTFYSNNTKQTGSGVELTSRATKDSINAKGVCRLYKYKEIYVGLNQKRKSLYRAL